MRIWVLLLFTIIQGCAGSQSEPRNPQYEETQPAPPSELPPDASVVAEADLGNSPQPELTEEVDKLGGNSTETLDDGVEVEAPSKTAAVQKLPPHPLIGFSTKQLRSKYVKDPTSFGSISLGKIRGGALINGMKMPSGEGWIVRAPQFAWGNRETVDAISHCIKKVHSQFPDTPDLNIGHISRKRGGRFPPHRSHQNGRDVDLGYYYTSDDIWYAHANTKNLDRARTWALVRAFITDTDVELILIDRSIQSLLREHALRIGEDPHWLDQIFGGKTASMRPIIRHARGHATHIHVRFYSPVAQETGRRMYNTLIKIKNIHPPTYYIRHRVKKGQTLSHLARRYHTSQRSIRRANRLRGTMLREGRVYLIPRSGGVAPVDDEPIVIPPRRLPPASSAKGKTPSADTTKTNKSPPNHGTAPSP